MLFASGVIIAAIVAQSYYYTYLMVAVGVGTAFMTFVTSVVKYPNASLQNSFFVAAGWLLISWGVENLLPNTMSSTVIAFASYLLLIRAIYRPPKLLPIFMLSIMSTIFRKSIAVILLWPLTDLAYSVLFYN